MGVINMMLDKLYYFSVVASELNFTKASEKCYIAQTVMSRHIANIEQEIGFKLFYRNNRNVKLTPEGEIFYKGVSQILKDYDATIIKAKNVHMEENRRLKIGIGHYERALVTKIVKDFHSIFSDFEITVEQYSYNDLMNNLNNGTIDIAFTLPLNSMNIDENAFDVKTVFSTDFLLIMNKNHRLAKIDNITIDDVNKEAFVTMSEKTGPYSGEVFNKLCNEMGINPSKLIQANSLTTKLLMVETGMGIATIPRFLKNQLSQNIITKEQSLLCPSLFIAITLPNNEKNGLKLFLDMLENSQIIENDLTENQLE